MSGIILEQMKNNRSGLSIRQSASDEVGICWAEERLGDWMYSLIRGVNRIDDENYLKPELMDLALERGGLRVDAIRSIADGEEMRNRPCTGGKLKIVNFLPANKEKETEKKQDNKIYSCPVEECESGRKFSSLTAQRQHIRSKHPAKARELLEKEKVINPETNRLCVPEAVGLTEKKTEHCKLCGNWFGLNRMKEHLEKKHKLGPFPRLSKVGTNKDQTYNFLKFPVHF